MKNLTIKSMAEKVMRRAAAGQSFSGAPQGQLSVGRNGCRSTFAQPSLNLRSTFAHRSLIVRFAAMFLMLMTMSIGQVWADGGFWDDNAATITFVKNGSNDAITLKRSATGVATKAYGNVESLSLKEVYTNVWKSGSGNITGTSFFYKIYRSGDSGSGSYTEVTTNWSSNDGSNQVWKKENINKDLLSGLTPGNYILKYYLQAKGSSLSDGQQYISNGSSNYTISFTVPVPTYYIKHNWGGAGSWEWQGPMDDNGDGTYSYVGQYGGTGCNWNTKNSDSDAQWIASPALVGSPQNGDECTFTLNPSARTITITKIPTCIAGAPSVTINNPGNGYVGQTVTLSCSIATGDVTYKAYNGSNNQELASSVVSIAGNQATFNAVQDPVYIVATVTNSAYCTETNTSRSNNFAIQQLQYHLHKNYDSDEIDFQNVNYNTATAIKACPFARDGYTFAGWATSADGDVVYADGANGPALTTGNQALFAKWTENSAPTYTITLKDYNNSVINGTVTATLGSNVLAGAVVHEDRGAGLTFRGYYTGQWAGGTKVIDNAGKLIANAGSYTDASGNWIYKGDVILIAGWTGNNYTITFDNQGATTPGTTSLAVKYSANTNLTKAITIPTKTDYTFGGYYTEVEGAGKMLFNAEGALQSPVDGYITNSKWMKADNVTLYAKWTADAPCVPTTYYLKHTTHGLRATFTSTAANEYDLTFKLNNDIIYGLYVEDNCGNQYGCSKAIQPGQSITLTTEQKTFSFLSAAQNETWHYTFNSQTKLLSCDSQSEEQKAGTTYLIRFLNYNGGDPLQSGQVEEGQTPVYSGATPTRESDAEWDYTFERWEPALYAADKAQDYTAIYTQTRREYTLTWDFAGGATTTPEAEYTHGSVENGAAITAPATPTKSGAVFTGWSPAFTGTMPAENTTYTAQWKTLQNIYVQGRFGVSDGLGNMTYTGSKVGEWSTTSTNIRFTYDNATGYYKLETHRTVAELCANAGSNPQYFHFKVESTEYGAVGSQNVAPGLEGNKKSIESGTKNFLFNTSDNAAADDVVLWIDLEHNEFWYSATAEQAYAVAINDGDHGTVSPTGEQQVGKSGISITATPADGYKFVSWEVSGGASVASATSATTTLTATAAGSVTAIYREANWVYFYGALQSTWNSDPVVTVGGVQLTAVHQLFTDATKKTLYTEPGSATAVGKSDMKFRVNIYRVDADDVDKTVTVGNSASGGGCINYSGSEVIESGALYYTHAEGGNTCGRLVPISIASVTVDKASYEPTELVTCSLTLNDYTENHKTAGADGLTYSYKLNNVTDGTSEVIAGQTSRTCKFQASSMLTVDKAYTITAIVKDNQTGKMVYEQTTTEFTAIAAVPRVSAEAVASLVQAGQDGQVQLNITTQNAAAGWKYSVKNETADQWLAPLNVVIAADGLQNWTTTSSVPTGDNHLKVYLYDENGDEQAVSDVVVVSAEQAHGITVNYTGQGSVSPELVYASEHISSAEVTATPATNYYLKNWTATTGITITDAEANPTTVKATQGGALTANFAPSWSVRGSFNSWKGGEMTYVGSLGTVDFDLAANTNYEFKIRDHAGNKWYTSNGATITRNTAMDRDINSTDERHSNVTLTTDIAGTYTFTFNIETKQLTVTYPTPEEYTITYESNGGSEIVEHLTYTEIDATFALPIPTRSGYAFRGWYENAEFTDSKVTQVERGSTGNKTFYAKWKQEGWYVHYKGDDNNWHDRFFSGEPQTATITGLTQTAHDYPMELVKVQDGQDDAYYKNANYMTSGNCTGWTYSTGADRNGFTSTIAGNYLFTLVVNDGTPKLSLTYPKWSCEFSIPALVNTLQPSTVTFTPNVVNYDVTGYELYYTNDGGANWTSCAYTGEGTYSYTNTYATAGTYQLKVVVKNGAEQVGEPFLSETFEVVAPSINIGVSAYPRVGAEVTVTPTVTGLQSGTYHYCWSIVDQTIEFTDNGNGTFSFTAPAAGDYTLRLEVKPGSDCSAEAIISMNETLTILGDYIVINMKRDPETLWKLQNNIYYYKGGTENAAWPGVAMTFLGKDEDDYPWYTYTIEGYSAYDGGTLIFNDAQGSGEGNMHQTGNIAMPQIDGCYYVKANLDGEWKRQWEKIVDCPDLTRRVVLLSGTENQYQGVTYTIKGKAVFFTGNEINYTYSARIKDGEEVALDDRHSFIPANAAGDVTYVVSIRATSEVPGEDVTSEYEIVMHKNPTTLNITSGSLTLNAAMTLTTSRTENFENGTKFTYTVIEPGTHSQVTFSEVTINSATASTASGSYTPKSTGTYIFNVIITKGETHVGSAQYSATIAPMKAWVKHNWDGSEWVWKEMTYRNDGTYAYYDANTTNGSYFRSTTANVTLNSGDSEPSQYDAGATTTLNPDGVAEGTIAVYIYDVAANTLTVRPANNELTVYRIKSVCSDGTYYSNTVNADGQEVSFYAQKNGSLVWQSRLSTEINAVWEDGDIISASIPEDNVYTATATTLGSALSAPSVYLGGYTIYSPIVDGHASMTSFTPNPDAANEYFNNYYVLHANNGQAVATVGNEINHNLSTVLPYYELPQETNLRYAYNNKTNVFVRNYLANAVGNASFLQLYGLGTNLMKADGATRITKSAPATLVDQSNWVYIYDAKGVLNGNDNIMATIRATYNGMQSWILSASGLENDEDADVELLTSKISGAGTYTLRLIYDYKTNRLTAGWVPSGIMNEGGNENTVTQVREIIVQRTDDGETSQFSIEAGTVVAVDKMTTEFIITREMWNNWGGGTNAKGYKTMFFWFSLPYECQLWNVYGFTGAYKVQTAVDAASWEVQRYRGDLRANGTAGSSAWKRLSEYSTTEVNRGYVLAVKISAADFNAITIDDKTTSEIRFFFPSAGKVTLTPEPQTTLLANSSNKTAEIQQGWNVMGVPVMKSNCGFTQTATTKFDYAYRWDWANGERWYEPFAIIDDTDPSDEKHFNFKSGHAYMVQVKDETTLNWNYTELAGSAWAPARARVASNMLTDRNFRVDLYYSDEMQDKTYVKYRTNGTRDYERGRDLEKIENAGRSMIYSELQDKLAAICLADTDLVEIPLTVVASKSGEYVLRMPAAVDGVEPVLYDAQEGVTTMLNYDEYVINLPADTYKDRFFLRMEAKSPSITTSVENVGTEGDKVIKFIDNNNQLMILRDGHLYDAQGHMVR